MRQMTVDLSVCGMSCASCVASLEAALGRVPGVADVNVNLATERATIAYDADVTSVQALAQAIEDAGYQVRTETVTLPIHGMTCAACVNTLERGLRHANGVLSATVNLATGRGTVTYLPAVINAQVLQEVIEDLGYEKSPRSPVPSRTSNRRHAHRKWRRSGASLSWGRSSALW